MFKNNRNKQFSDRFSNWSFYYLLLYLCTEYKFPCPEWTLRCFPGSVQTPEEVQEAEGCRGAARWGVQGSLHSAGIWQVSFHIRCMRVLCHFHCNSSFAQVALRHHCHLFAFPCIMNVNTIHLVSSLWPHTIMFVSTRYGSGVSSP